MDTASGSILALRPVTFHYKSDTKSIPQFGLIAEKVATGESSLGAAQQSRGKPYIVRYDAVNAMLLNEFLKANRNMRELESTVAKQEASAGKARSDDCRAAKAN